ncbi:LysR family transcriptional regulator [Collinsella tanakaei]|uniref:LysR family transcriptional regulator n=1 Tax=Collinsella tanakaei TaxID=626935 RepID=UPI001958CCAC|nr:LysR family transcriptional regulator [Collinsella tanakaei]MBM6868198.1 LysR family transcriptional regulator [Collinsella tanakaei]
MDEKDFALLHVLKECGNITHAADRLYLTQSALSKRIKAIERELGCDIVLRTRKGVRFTPAGELALAHTAQAAHELELLRRELDAAQDTICGTLNAGFALNYSFMHLPQLLTEYHRRYPQVQLNIVTAKSRDLHAILQRNELDVAVLRGEFPWDGMQYLLSQERICAVCTHENEHTPLSELTYINHTTDIAHTALMTRWLHENNLAQTASRINVSDLMTCQELVKRGIGWALLPEVVLAGFDGCVRPCTFSNGEPFIRRMYIDCQKEAEQLPQVQALVDLIKEQYAHRSNAGVIGTAVSPATALSDLP